VTTPYHILDHLRQGTPLCPEDVRRAALGAADGSWSDAQLGAFLMGVTLRGLDAGSTGALTRAMLESGEQWDLGREVPGLTDKHSTGGVGDTVSVLLVPLLAACGVPVVMLTGRGLGHTGGTTDKLESIPGFRLDLDRGACLRLLAEHGAAIGTQTAAIAPADGRLYALRDVTATIRSLPLITASILSKKLATGAEALVFDVKAGNGAFLTEREAARELARGLVDTCASLGRRASALITDMSQPLGEWCGHTAEVRGALEGLEGRGAADLVEATLELAAEAARLGGHDVGRAALEAAIASGRAREKFDEWAEAQGADPAWLARPDLALAPEEAVVEAERSGVLAWVDTHQLGLLLAEAGGGRAAGGGELDAGVSLRYRARLGRRVETGDELARLYLRRADDGLVRRFAACFEIADAAEPPPLVYERVG
jgi:pyrimidine-nucleoside phosphorylase